MRAILALIIALPGPKLAAAAEAGTARIGCGTGANMAAPEAAIGPTGTIVGVDVSREVLEQARARVRREGWANVTPVQADAAMYAFPTGVNAILSTYALALLPSCDDVIKRGAEALASGGR